MENSKQVAQKSQQKLHLKTIQLAEEQPEKDLKQRPRPQIKQKDKVKKKRKTLSFEHQEEEEEERVKISKADNPKIQIHRKRSGNMKDLEKELKDQFLEKVREFDEQTFQFDFSYWDGGQVIKKLRRKKKEKVYDLIECCRLELISNFQNLASLKPEDLMMVIKDFIPPHDMTISQMQALQLKTSKGANIFNFKLVKIKDLALSVNFESPIRIVEKQRYQRNIGSFPFNTWHTMDLK